MIPERRPSLTESFFAALKAEDDCKADVDTESAGVGALVKGVSEGVTVQTGIFKESTMRQLSVHHRTQITSSSGGKVMQVGLFLLCAICGAVVPLIQDWTKVYPTTYTGDEGMLESCAGKAGHVQQCKGWMPYLPGPFIVAENVGTLTVGFLMTFAFSGREGLHQCANPSRLKMAVPISILRVIGDVAQLMAIGACNAAFFLVVCQTRLLVAALASLVLLGTRQTTAQWYLLVAITVACMLYCDLDLYFIQEKDRGAMEFRGLSLSLIKVFCAAVNAVLTERLLKAGGSEPVWVSQVQLVVCRLPCSLMLVLLQHGVFCSHEANTCLSDVGFFSGWSYKNGVLLAAEIANNFVIALMYKKVNAVIKYLAYAQSLWVTYLINIAMLGVAFHPDLFMVILLLVFLVIAYSFAKAGPTSSKEAERSSAVASTELPSSARSSHDKLILDEASGIRAVCR